MTNTNKAKGTTWETAIVRYLQDAGILAVRTGSANVGAADVHFGRNLDWTVEAKNEARITLPAYLAQLAASVLRANRFAEKAAVWVKQRTKGPADAYVVMSGARYRDLVKYVDWLEKRVDEYESWHAERNVIAV